MAAVAPHERLRQARAQRGEDLAVLTARTGLRAHHARAIEEGRYADLPPGIYGRAAIRSYAAAYALDADALLAECEHLLPRVDDPIAALARLRGAAPPDTHANQPAVLRARPGWRPFVAASLDGLVAGTLLAVAGAAAAGVARVSTAALAPSAVPFFLVGSVLGTVYYLWLGGLVGTTLGEQAVGWLPRRRDARPLILRAIARRTLAAATSDARAIHAFGVWTARCVTPVRAARTAPPPGPSPSPPPARDRAEALTWSMSRRASVPPLRPRPRHGGTPRR